MAPQDLTAARLSKKQVKMVKQSRAAGRKADISPTVIFSAAGWVIAALIVVLLILPIGGRWLGVGGGGKAEAAATSIDRGFADLVTKLELLGTETADGSIVNGLDHTFSIDNGFFLVSFNRGGKLNGKAISPPECSAQACLCVCIDDKCEAIDVQRNRGRDCKIFYEYSAIKTEITGNSGGDQLYIKGLKTVSVKLEKKSDVLYMTGTAK